MPSRKRSSSPSFNSNREYPNKNSRLADHPEHAATSNAKDAASRRETLAKQLKERDLRIQELESQLFKVIEMKQKSEHDKARPGGEFRGDGIYQRDNFKLNAATLFTNMIYSL